jgi:hypothetical protein
VSVLSTNSARVYSPRRAWALGAVAVAGYLLVLLLGRLGARRRCHRSRSGLVVTQKRLFFVEGRIAKRPLCAARMERAS